MTGRTITRNTLVDVRSVDDDEAMSAVTLADIFGDDEPGIEAAILALTTTGRATVGGGAAPAFFIILHGETK